MRFGTFLLAGQFPSWTQGHALGAAVAHALASEAAGFDEVWIAEHHFIPYGVCPQAATLAGHLLGRTERVDIGTAVAVLSTQHPVALAEQTALLDHVSGGRFHLGVGRGGPWVDLEVFGGGLPRFERGFPEALDLLLRCLTRERVSADGQFFSFREVAMVPRPLTRPHPPVTVAATAIPTLELAAARGLPVLLGMEVDDERGRALLARHAEVAARHGHDPARMEHAMARVAHVADRPGQAADELRATMGAWLREGTGAYVSLAPRLARRDLDAYVEHLLAISPVGTPEQCVERLAATAARTGARRVLLMVEGCGDPRRTRETIARLGAEVLPQVRGRLLALR